MASNRQPIDWDAIFTVPFDINRAEEYTALVKKGEYDAEGRKELLREANAKKEAAKKEAEKNAPKSKYDGLTIAELHAMERAKCARLVKERNFIWKEGNDKEDSNESKK